MTVRVPNAEDKRRAALIMQGIVPELPDDNPGRGAKGFAEAKRRFGSKTTEG